MLFAGTLPEGDGGRGHRRRPGREPGSRDHRPRGQRDGDHPLEPDVGHSEEARVHVAPSAQDLALFVAPLPYIPDLFQVKHSLLHVPFHPLPLFGAMLDTVLVR